MHTSREDAICHFLPVYKLLLFPLRILAGLVDCSVIPVYFSATRIWKDLLSGKQQFINYQRDVCFWAILKTAPLLHCNEWIGSHWSSGTFVISSRATKIQNVSNLIGRCWHSSRCQCFPPLTLWLHISSEMWKWLKGYSRRIDNVAALTVLPATS